MITPSFAVLFPDSEVIFSCINATSLVLWRINGVTPENFPTGVDIVNDTALRVNMSANATMYRCADAISSQNIVSSNTAILVLAG